MATRTGTAHVVTTRRKYKDRVYTTHLLRRSYREGGKVKNQTLGNLSHLPEPLIAVIRRWLRGERFVPVGEAFEIISSRPHGHVQAVRTAMQRLDMAVLLGAKASRSRQLVLAMIAARVLAPHTKLATTRWWHSCTLAEDFGVADASAEELYAAMDWLLARQDRIQGKLAGRHLGANALVLYDLSSSYMEGTQCPLARLGYSRDGKKGRLQVNYGLITDARGCPVAVSVHAGNVADGSTFMAEVRRVRERFGVAQLVMVGDRGMIGQQSIDEMRQMNGEAPALDWITALKSVSIRALVEGGQLQLGLFDERSLIELSAPEYPGERLLACRNPQLARLRAHKREAIAAEAALDGVYIIRTSLPASRMDAAQCVRSYKALAQVQRAFRSLKTMHLHVRPIHHRLADRVRAHILLCMLAYYVQWHLCEAWRELTFADTEQQAKATRDPVAPAQRSRAAQRKAASGTLPDGAPAHSFGTLLAELATVVRNTCRVPGAEGDAPTFEVLTTPNAVQRRALQLAEQIRM